MSENHVEHEYFFCIFSSFMTWLTVPHISLHLPLRPLLPWCLTVHPSFFLLPPPPAAPFSLSSSSQNCFSVFHSSISFPIHPRFPLPLGFKTVAGGLKSSESSSVSSPAARFFRFWVALIAAFVLGFEPLASAVSASRASYIFKINQLASIRYQQLTCHSAKKLSKSRSQISLGLSLSNSMSSCSLASLSANSFSTYMLLVNCRFERTFSIYALFLMSNSR